MTGVHSDRMAVEVGSRKVSNMIMLGAYVGTTGALQAETLRDMLRLKYTGAKAKHLERNLTALERGIEFGKAAR